MTAYRDGQDWDIAGFYCEHQSLGHTCQSCRDTVVDVLCAIRDAGYEPPNKKLFTKDPHGGADG